VAGAATKQGFLSRISLTLTNTTNRSGVRELRSEDFKWRGTDFGEYTTTEDSFTKFEDWSSLSPGYAVHDESVSPHVTKGCGWSDLLAEGQKPLFAQRFV
jgi:hypothetical protein